MNELLNALAQYTLNHTHPLYGTMDGILSQIKDKSVSQTVFFMYSEVIDNNHDTPFNDIKWTLDSLKYNPDIN